MSVILLVMVGAAANFQLIEGSAYCGVNASLTDTMERPIPLDPITFEVLHHSPENLLRVKIGAVLSLVCFDSVLDYNNASMLNLTCHKNGKLYDKDNKTFLGYDTMNCMDKKGKVSVSQDYGKVVPTGKECGLNGTEFLVGATIEPNIRFVTFMTICYDKELRRAIYGTLKGVRHVRTREGHDPNYNHFYKYMKFDLKYSGLLHADKIDTPDKNKRLNDLKGDPGYPQRWVKTEYDLWLRTLMKARVFAHDFLDNVCYRHMTVFFAWHDRMKDCWQFEWDTFDRDSLRPFLEQLERPVDLYAGVHGVSTEKHLKTGKIVVLNMLDAGDKFKGPWTFPLAPLVWMIVYEPMTKTAVVLLRSNVHRFGTQLPDLPCRALNTSQALDWIKWEYKPGCLSHYACEYHEALKSIPELPPLEVEGLLTKSAINPLPDDD